METHLDYRQQLFSKQVQAGVILSSSHWIINPAWDKLSVVSKN